MLSNKQQQARRKSLISPINIWRCYLPFCIGDISTSESLQAKPMIHIRTLVTKNGCLVIGSGKVASVAAKFVTGTRFCHSCVGCPWMCLFSPGSFLLGSLHPKGHFLQWIHIHRRPGRSTIMFLRIGCCQEFLSPWFVEKINRQGKVREIITLVDHGFEKR